MVIVNGVRPSRHFPLPIRRRILRRAREESAPGASRDVDLEDSQLEQHRQPRQRVERSTFVFAPSPGFDR